MDVLQQAGEAVREGHAQRPQQVVPAGLHVLAGPALGVALAAHVLVVGRHDVGDEVVVTAGRLQKGGGGRGRNLTRFGASCQIERHAERVRVQEEGGMDRMEITEGLMRLISRSRGSVLRWVGSWR